jgi:hypothetical protein
MLYAQIHAFAGIDGRYVVPVASNSLPIRGERSRTEGRTGEAGGARAPRRSQPVDGVGARAVAARPATHEGGATCSRSCFGLPECSAGRFLRSAGARVASANAFSERDARALGVADVALDGAAGPRVAATADLTPR